MATGFRPPVAYGSLRTEAGGCVLTPLGGTHPKQAADTLQVSTKTVRRWVQSGELIHHRFGRQLRISEIDLQAFIDAGRQP